MCPYCSFANFRDIVRKRLSLEEVEREIKNIIGDGCYVLEYTLATDPYFSPQRLSEYIAKAKSMLGKNGTIMLCSDHMTTKDYKTLKEVGLLCMVQWDETLHKETFVSFHKTSPRKGNWEERVDNHDHALSAGLDVAVGLLFGLYRDWKFDFLMLMKKVDYLKQKYNTLPFAFGTPRIKKTETSDNKKLQGVSDEEYLLALSVMKICYPSVPRWLQTREDPEFNFANVLDGDMFTYRCGEVRPGGYEISSEVGAQFSVQEMTKSQFVLRIEKQGFEIQWY